MEKPINLIIIDTKQKIIDVLNEAKLPITVSQYIISDVKNLIDIQAGQIIVQDRQKYEKSLKEESL